ncbi:MAG: undecaprenyl diphosphate synthase [Parcubacteria group bacterium Gr01-1014_70]|nr:MAG: undecaprenyl diphosphate synthase [Parcubacteria group bacterium Gr01-1014_70]
MDGNRRWARAHGTVPLEGHRAGYGKLKEFLNWAREAGISTVILYAFSSENWNRSPEEVSYLMKLLQRACESELEHFKKENVRMRVIGERTRLPQGVREAIEHAEEETKNCTGETLVLAISYGGRGELVRAAQRMCGRTPEEITEESFAAHLWTNGIPDPDLVIRTSGEQRLSNFLLWQAAYAELFFTKTLWPDFSKDEFFGMLRQFEERDRRYGA